jgi:hypothetical protein
MMTPFQATSPPVWALYHTDTENKKCIKTVLHTSFVLVFALISENDTFLCV